MSTTLPAPPSWVHAHRAALAVVLLTIALAVAVIVLAVRLATGSPQAPATSVPGVPMHAVTDHCGPRPGQPC
jgi:hypothetical protein